LSIRVAFFPSLVELSGNPYWTMLGKELSRFGVEMVDSGTPTFSRHWLKENRNRLDVAHIHFVQPFYAYERTQARLRWVLRFARNILLARSYGIGTVFTLHNLRPTYPLTPQWVDFAGHLAAARLSDAVIVHCLAARRALKSRFGRVSGVFKIPHPNFIGHYANTISKSDARGILGIDHDATMFLFLGGVRPNKGVDFLLNTFACLHDQRAVLVVAGKPWPPSEHIQSLTAMAAADPRVTLTLRHIEDDEIQTYLNASDIAVLPYRSILTPSSAVLAMSFGRPLIVPRLGCLPEMVDAESAFLYEPLDQEDLMAQLERSLSSDLTAMGARALDRVHSYSAAHAAEQTFEVYKSIVDR